MSTQQTSDLSGRVALVTGASSGLGERFARILAAAGARVAACARRADRLRALAEGVRRSGGVLEPIAMDVEDPAAIVRGLERSWLREGSYRELVRPPANDLFR